MKSSAPPVPEDSPEKALPLADEDHDGGIAVASANPANGVTGNNEGLQPSMTADQ